MSLLGNSLYLYRVRVGHHFTVIGYCRAIIIIFSYHFSPRVKFVVVDLIRFPTVIIPQRRCHYYNTQYLLS